MLAGKRVLLGFPCDGSWMAEPYILPSTTKMMTISSTTPKPPPP
jgi:hypothetical protein